MTRLFRNLVFVAAIGLAGGLVPAAQAQTGLPGGAWQKSCYDAQVDHGDLTATCQDKRGRDRDAEIDLTRCNARVENNDGRLQCSGTAEKFPAGGWSQSCSDAYMAEGVLYAYCKDTRGREREASLSVNRCPNVENNDGRLVCTQASQPQQPLPGGSWQQSCKNGSINGSIVSAKCQDMKGKWRDTQIDLNTCPSRRLGNNNGQLVCE